MEDKGTKKLLDFYTRARENKNEIVLRTDDGKEFSRAEMVVLACMAVYVRSLEDKDSGIDYDKVIKTIILNSLDGKLNGLKKKNEYEEIIRESKELETEEGYGAKTVYDRMISDFKSYLNPVYPEEQFVFRNLKLHDTTRKGHIYWGNNSDRIENVLEHIYGCLILALGLESEYNYYVDFDKMRRILLIHETGEIIEDDETAWDRSAKERHERERRAVIKIASTLPNGQELVDLWDEFEAKVSLVSEFSYLTDKEQYDIEVKLNEKEGLYDYPNVPQNIVTTNPEIVRIMNEEAQSVFDVHYLTDKDKYTRVPVFRRLLEETKNY
jgi:5'-deoxynucleotidase YfbR-like HD superfamily hydrolase